MERIKKFSWKLFYIFLLVIWYISYPIGTILLIIGYCLRTDFYQIPKVYRQFLKDIHYPIR